MLTKSAIGAAVVAAILLAGPPAWAACTLAELAGRYQFYAHFGLEYGWIRCPIKIRSNGKLKTGTRCVNSDGTVETIIGGRFSVATNCRVSGKLVTSAFVSFLDHAWLAKDKNFITGVGHDDDGVTWLFTAIRR